MHSPIAKCNLRASSKLIRTLSTCVVGSSFEMSGLVCAMSQPPNEKLFGVGALYSFMDLPNLRGKLRINTLGAANNDGNPNENSNALFCVAAGTGHKRLETSTRWSMRSRREMIC